MAHPSKKAMARFLKGRGSKGKSAGSMAKNPVKRPVPGLVIQNKGKGY